MALERNALKALLLRVGGQGFRERLLGDPLFLNKLAIELGIGVCTKISAEYAKRAKTFWKETDFVVANGAREPRKALVMRLYACPLTPRMR